MFFPSAFDFAVNTLVAKKVKHEIHSFPSGCCMVDIWLDQKFYVVQFENSRIGLSLVEHDSSFDNIPDYVFMDAEAFCSHFKKLLK